MSPTGSTTNERYAMLAGASWAPEIPELALREVAARSTTHRYGQGEPIVEEADAGWMGFVVDGECEVAHRALGSEPRVRRVMGPGRVFGEVALLDGSPRQASVAAIEATTVVRLDASAVEAMAAENPKAAFELVRCVARDLARRIRWMERNRF